MNAPAVAVADATERGFARHLIERDVLAAAALDRAEWLRAESGDRLVILLSKLGLLSEQKVAEALAVFLGLPLLVETDLPRNPVRSGLSAKFLKQAMVVPVIESPERLTLAVADPLDRETLEAVRYAADRAVDIRIATPSAVAKALARLQGGASETVVLTRRVDDNAGAIRASDTERLRDLASDAPVIRLVNLWIDGAVEARASDIHIEATEHTVRVRYRIDGSLQDIEELPPHQCHPGDGDAVGIPRGGDGTG